MSQISAATVKELRDRTDMPMMKCKAALEKAGGDIDKAIQVLREEGGKFLASDKGARETAEGRIGAFSDHKSVGALVELRCESPSVVKNDRFVALANEIAKQVATKNPASLEELEKQASIAAQGQSVKDRIADVVGLIRENMRPARFVRLDGITGEYVHHDGTIGVLIQVKGDSADPVLLRDICTHIAALNPAYALASEVPADVVEREKALAKKQAEDTAAGKPGAVVEKIAEGKYKTWLAENVLVEQPMANQMKYPKKTVGELLKGAKLEVVKFVRYKVGGQG
ncbi:MAG TPA: translation elongation factor Ts [Gemmataceae bacterium]|jgi:elongation factor Ts|nr:translation elongation factor Ts [Gemmataceae bacterium]